MEGYQLNRVLKKVKGIQDIEEQLDQNLKKEQ